MNAERAWIDERVSPLHTTLLSHVQTLTDRGLSPSEVVGSVHESLDRGDLVLIGSFRGGLSVAADAEAKTRTEPSTPSGENPKEQGHQGPRCRRAEREDEQAAEIRRTQEAHWASLMTAAQKGDEEAYRELLEDLMPLVTRLVRRKLFDPSAVEDVVQNALLSIHRARHTYRPERPFGPWMRTIVRNATIDHFRQVRRRRDRESNLECFDSIPDHEASMLPERNRFSAELARLLEELPPEQREAVQLIKIEGLTSAEAASRVGCTPGALRLRAHRGCLLLRQLIGDRRGLLN